MFKIALFTLISFFLFACSDSVSPSEESTSSQTESSTLQSSEQNNSSSSTTNSSTTHSSVTKTSSPKASSSVQQSSASFKIYKPTQLPTKNESLFVQVGSSDRDTVVLYSQGGPVADLDQNDLKDLFPNSPFNHIYVHQSQTLNKTILKSDKEFTWEAALYEDSLSAVILDRVVKHFQTQGKAVFLISHSFGSFIVPFYLTHFSSKPERTVILAGRLDMNQIVWEGFKNGIYYTFPDGKTPQKEDLSKEGIPEGLFAATKLQAGLGQHRYTKLLAGQDLSSMIYISAGKDKAVGDLTQDEVSFWTKAGGKHWHIPKGSHGSMFNAPWNENLAKELF